jgi:hypothetical protein
MRHRCCYGRSLGDSEKRAKTQLELMIHNHTRSGTEDWKISAEDQARTLQANALVLVGDGERFRVMPR